VVLEMMNGPEFAGERIGHYDMTEADDGALELTFRGAHPASRTSTSPSSGTSSCTSATRAGRSASGSWRRRCRRRSSPPTACPASVAELHGRRRRGTDDRGHIGGVIARQRASPRRGRRRRHVRRHDLRRARGARLGRLVDGATAATPTTTPARRGPRHRPPEHVEVTALESVPCAPRANRRDVQWPTHALGDERSCSRVLTAPRRSRCVRPWSSAPANGSSASTRSWTIPAVTIGCGALPAAAPVTGRTRSARSPSSTAA